MKIKDKLKKRGRNAGFAFIIGLLAAIYLLMVTIKGFYLWSYGSDFAVLKAIHHGVASFIQSTSSLPPVSWLWNNIPYISFEGGDILGFYAVIMPPAVVIFICAFFIADHRAMKDKFRELKAEIEREIALREMRKEAGIETVPESATVDVVISNATNDDPAWHETWWGRIAIGVATVLVATAIGLK